MPFVILNDLEFETFSESVDHRFFEQSLSMRDLLHKRGYQTQLVGFKDQKDTIQVAAVTFSTAVAGGLHMEIHYGPIYHETSYLKEFLVGLTEYAKQNKVIELKVKPYFIYQQYDDHGKLISETHEELIPYFTDANFTYEGLTTGFEEADWHYIKNLEGLTESQLLNSFSKKGKPLVKKAKTFGISIRQLKRDELHLFKDITSATSDRRDYNDKPLEYYEFLFDSFKDKAEFLVATLNFKEYYANLEKDQAKIKAKIDKLEKDLEVNPNSEKKRNQHKEFSSQYQTFEIRKEEANHFIEKYNDQDVILAGSVFIFTKQEAVYFFSGSYPEFNKFYAPAVLQEHVMIKAISQGIKRYNLLGISGVFDGSDGVLGFKQNFNGHVEQNLGAFMYYPKPIKHKLLSSIKKLLNRY